MTMETFKKATDINSAILNIQDAINSINSGSRIYYNSQKDNHTIIELEACNDVIIDSLKKKITELKQQFDEQ